MTQSTISLETSRVRVWPLSAGAKTFAALLAVHALTDCYAGVWPIFKKLAGLDLTWAGVISTVTTMATAMLQPAFGVWADHGMRRRFILWGAFLAMMGMAIGPIGYHRDALPAWGLYLLLFLVLLVSRLGVSMFHPPAAGVAGNVMVQRRSTLMAVFVAGGTLGFACGQSLFSTVYLATGGHTEYLLLPGAVLFLGAMAWLRPADPPGQGARGIGDLFAAVAILRTRMLPLFLIMALVAMQAMAFYFLLPEFLELRGYPPWMVNGGGFGLLILGGVLMMVPGGHLADRFGRRRVLAAVLLMSLVFYYLLVSLPPLPWPLFALLCVVGGGFLGTSNPLGVALGQHLMPQRSSLVSGVLMGLAWAVGGLGPMTVGWLAEAPAVGIIRALLVMGLTNVVALVLVLIVPRAITLKVGG